MCYYILNYDDNIMFLMYHIKMSCINMFSTNFELVIYWYFLSQFLKAVKLLHKVRFPILINITNLHLLYVGQQVRKKHRNVYQQSKLKYTDQLYLKKTFNFHNISKKSAQR